MRSPLIKAQSRAEAHARSIYSVESRVGRYLLNILIAIDVFANAVCGGAAYQTISCRIGLSIEGGGWASKVPWPAPLYNHFIGAVYEATV